MLVNRKAAPESYLPDNRPTNPYSHPNSLSSFDKTIYLLPMRIVMKHLSSLLYCLLGVWMTTNAQAVDLTYYLPNIKYNPAIPSPQQALGYQVGEWHVSHDQLLGYMKTVAERSERVLLKEYARSHEARPLLVLVISSPKNIRNIEQIRQQHLSLADPSASKNSPITDMPVVLYQGYSVHGDEASGSNAALLLAYYLAAGRSADIDQMLDKTVILLDPALNPDGLQRFAGWVNSHKSLHMNGDPATREHHEVWPSGRTNHYWFDLNRDWLPVQHPESQGRVRLFHQWKPNILTDHHEMGSNNTFFFQPGIPSRTNPMTPHQNQELTREIATYHATALDRIGSTYYSDESFDDYYYGKGSTYPDINGCIGILFEQATVAGHRKETSNGMLDFPFAIRNQLVTSFSTLAAARAMRQRLLEFQRGFYQKAAQEADSDRKKAYVFDANYDAEKLDKLVEILNIHHLRVYELAQDIRLDSTQFQKGEAYVLPLQQPQYRLAKALFERSHQFNDSLFYDVSAWTLPLAFDLDYATLGASRYSQNLLGKEVVPKQQKGRIIGAQSNYAYLLRWDQLAAPKVANQLLAAGLLLKVATRPFDCQTASGLHSFAAGSLLIAVQNQPKSSAKIYALLQQLTAGNAVDFYAISSGYTSKGIDFGSPSFRKIEQPKVLILAGRGIQAYGVGELWHLLDNQLAMAVTIADIDRFGSLELSRYNTILLANGNYGRITEGGVGKLKKWLQQGGRLIAFREAIRWAATKKLAHVKFKSSSDPKKQTTSRPYQQYDHDRGSKLIGGAIVEGQLDLSHPLCYGYADDRLPLFRKGTLFIQNTTNPYATPVRYTDQPLMSGYISKANLNTLGGSAAVTVSGIGRGKTIAVADNPNFRAFWFSSRKLLANALFFGSVIKSGTTERPVSGKTQASGQ